MIARGPVTKAFAGLLATVTGKPVGIGTVPINPATGKAYPPPYSLLYSVDQATGGPELADLHQDAAPVYQVTFVSGPDPTKPDSRGTVEQVEWLADKARTGVLVRPASGRGYANAMTIPGVSCYRRDIDSEPGATNEPDDAIITYVIRFRLYLTPAA